jgi:hypothetical protein
MKYPRRFKAFGRRFRGPSCNRIPQTAPDQEQYNNRPTRGVPVCTPDLPGITPYTRLDAKKSSANKSVHAARLCRVRKTAPFQPRHRPIHSPCFWRMGGKPRTRRVPKLAAQPRPLHALALYNGRRSPIRLVSGEWVGSHEPGERPSWRRSRVCSMQWLKLGAD